MPTHSIHGALTSMYEFSEAPWNFPRWKELTGVKHGLFPKDDGDLPNGWTREEATLVEGYFITYLKQKTETKRLSAASSRTGNVAGRNLWRTWVTRCWKESGIHAIISKCLTDKKLHPLQVALAANDSSIVSSQRLSLHAKAHPLNIPIEANYLLQLVVDAAALAILGPDALDPNTDRIHILLRTCFTVLVQRCWINNKTGFVREVQKMAKLEVQVTEAFENIDKEKPTKASIRQVIRKVALWRDIAKVHCHQENLEKIEDMEEELKRLMNALGADLKVKVKVGEPRPALCKVSSEAFQGLATKDEVDDIVNLYTSFFNCPDPEDSVALQDQMCTMGFKFAEVTDGADPGVEVEALMSPAVLARNLGFSPETMLPPVFNHYRHTGGLNSWDEPSAFNDANPENLESLEPFALHWHQLAGVHALIRMTFTPEPAPGHCTGVLVADDVGLGKTFQAITVIAVLAALIHCQSTVKSKTPPIFVSNPYLGELTVLPNLPHVIVVPGTVIDQWQSEIKTLFIAKSFDVLVYSSNKTERELFWAPTGPFHRSLHEPANRIILVSESALQNDFTSVYALIEPTDQSDGLPWDPPQRRPTASFNKTLYGHKYLSITVDEGHHFRNPGMKHMGALTLLQRAQLRFVMSGTPLQTSNQDISAMGRLIGLQSFMSEEAHEEEKDDFSLIRRARTALSDMPDESPDDDPVKDVQVAIALRQREDFTGHLLRRTAESLDYNGEVLIDLPPCIHVTILLKLAEREMRITRMQADKVKESVSKSASSLQIVCRSFYTLHRMCVAYAREDLDEDIPKFFTLEEWNANLPTKFDACARICKHILARDDAPDIMCFDGKLIFPEFPALEPGETPMQESKILVYLEYPTLSPLIRSALTLHGMGQNFAMINGRTSFKNRAKIVEKFKNDPKCRILVISSVAGTGLNLTPANNIIFLDQPWSAQDEQQITGRAHRQPQKKTVTCYHLLADETADVVLAALAHGKQKMMEAFLQKDAGKEMMSLFQGVTLCDDKDSLDPNDSHDAKLLAQAVQESLVVPRKDRKKNAKATKGVGDASEPEVKVRRKRSKSGKTKPKSAEVVADQSSDGGNMPPVMQPETKEIVADLMYIDGHDIVDPQEQPDVVMDFSLEQEGFTSEPFTEQEMTDDFGTEEQDLTTTDDLSMLSDSEVEVTGPPTASNNRRRMISDSPEPTRAPKRARLDDSSSPISEFLPPTQQQSTNSATTAHPLPRPFSSGALRSSVSSVPTAMLSSSPITEFPPPTQHQPVNVVATARPLPSIKSSVKLSSSGSSVPEAVYALKKVFLSPKKQPPAARKPHASLLPAAIVPAPPPLSFNAVPAKAHSPTQLPPASISAPRHESVPPALQSLMSAVAPIVVGQSGYPRAIVERTRLPAIGPQAGSFRDKTTKKSHQKMPPTVPPVSPTLPSSSTTDPSQDASTSSLVNAPPAASHSDLDSQLSLKPQSSLVSHVRRGKPLRKLPTSTIGKNPCDRVTAQQKKR